MKQVEEEGQKIIKYLAELIELGKQAIAYLEDSGEDENDKKMETILKSKMEFKCISEN